MEFIVSPIQFLQGISIALELSSGGMSSHQWRVTMIADRIAEAMNLSREECRTLVYASLIHDIGAVADWDEINDIDDVADETLYSHAEAGYEFLKDSRVFGELAKFIRYHHDAWKGNNPSGFVGGQIPLLSRIIHIADRVDRLIDDNRFIFSQTEGIMKDIAAESGGSFDPALVAVLKRIADSEGFWLDLVNSHYYRDFFDRISRYGEVRYSMDDIMDVSEVMASVIDINDPFTGAHSRRVAVISAYLAEKKGYSDDEVKLMRIAGLLHDLGKMAVPREILEKPDKLTGHEFYIIKQHPYYTYRILGDIEGFHTVTEWAAFHHETLDGKGYPFRIKGESLSLGSRIVAVSDIFTALTEKRPYHDNLDISDVEEIMRSMAQNNKIDETVIEVLFHNPEEVKALLNGLAKVHVKRKENQE